MKRRVSHDVYNIANRIKKIDRDYYVVLDTIKRKYEIHNSSQLGSSYCLTLPYDDLDARALDYIFMTRVGNIDELIDRIDRENVLHEKSAQNDAVSKIGEYLEEEMR